MKCKACGKELTVDLKNCPFCGKAIVEEASEKRKGKTIDSLQHGSNVIEISAEQQYREGLQYYNSKDYETAAEFIFKAAMQGHKDALCFLGWMYQSGQGVTQNYAEALKCYRKAAEQGCARAWYLLARLERLSDINIQQCGLKTYIGKEWLCQKMIQRQLNGFNKTLSEVAQKRSID